MEIFYLPENLNTAAAPDLLENLKMLSEDVILDGREVKRLGGRCLEIILSAQKTALSNGKNFKVQNLSHEMEKTLVLMGAKRVLDEEKIE